MNIGIRLDGVLTNLEQFQFDYGSKFYFEKEMVLRNPRAYHVEDIFWKHGNFLKSTKKEITFWEEYYEFYLLKERARPFASDIIKRLHDSGHQITLFCTRAFWAYPLENEKMKQITKLWLIENKIYFDFLVFSDMINEELLMKYKIDLLIDHDPERMEQMANLIPIACFQAKYNENIKGENIYRIFSWYDFYLKFIGIMEREEMKYAIL